MHLKVRDKFEAAHSLAEVFGDEHHCAGLHGHSFRVDVTINEGAETIDFSEVKSRLKVMTDDLDHTVLNDVIEVAPTAENLATWFAEQMCEFYDVVKVELWETENNCAIWNVPENVETESDPAE